MYLSCSGASSRTAAVASASLLGVFRSWLEPVLNTRLVVSVVVYFWLGVVAVDDELTSNVTVAVYVLLRSRSPLSSVPLAAVLAISKLRVGLFDKKV
jgi:multisubunit Na+/H+ antiporter MnhE subunit